MSHISKVDTKITDLVYLKKALKALGIEYCEAEENTLLTVKGYGKEENIEECIMEIKTGSSYGIGIRRVEDKLEIVADWWAIETFTGEKQEDIMKKITRRYAYETVMDKVHQMGYSVVQEEENAKNEVRLTVRRWT